MLTYDDVLTGEMMGLLPLTPHSAPSPPPPLGPPGTRQIIDGVGLVAFGHDGRLERVWARYGIAAPHPWLNAPLPNLTYVVGANLKQHSAGVRLRHTFRTGPDGSTLVAAAQSVRRYPKPLAGKRWSTKTSSPYGFRSGHFDRGHLIAAEFGAGMESINLVTMPASVNRPHRIATALRYGFAEIAALADRYRDERHPTLGTLTQSGEYALPNYRAFERVVIRQARRAEAAGHHLSIRVEPMTFRTGTDVTTDILYAQILVDGRAVVRYKIDNDVQ